MAKKKNPIIKVMIAKSHCAKQFFRYPKCHKDNFKCKQQFEVVFFCKIYEKIAHYILKINTELLQINKKKINTLTLRKYVN